MKSLLPWLVKGALSAAYWFACLYLAVGLMFGDRVVDGRIVAPAVQVSPVVFVMAAVVLHAALSLLWDRWRERPRR